MNVTDGLTLSSYRHLSAAKNIWRSMCPGMLATIFRDAAEQRHQHSAKKLVEVFEDRLRDNGTIVPVFDNNPSVKIQSIKSLIR